jgi:hypothetical protein
MGHWNHRVMKRKTEEGEWYDIHEVFYDEQSGKLSWTENAISPGGETIDELQKELQRMLKALDKPVLDYDAEEITEGANG